MVDKKLGQESSASLRQNAEHSASQEFQRAEFPDITPDVSRRLLHELRVHQIELEMQNEELLRAQAELEDSRSRYFDLYDLAPVSYITVNTEGAILEANLAAATLLGQPRDVLHGRRITQFIAPDSQDHYYLMRKSLLAGVEHSSCELPVRGADGKETWVSIDSTLSPSSPDGTQAYRLVLVDRSAEREAQAKTSQYLAELEMARKTLVEDAAALKRNNDQLQMERDRAEAATRAKSAFLASMSHELRTPMNGVLGMTELLLYSNLNSEQKSYAETAGSSARALLTILDDILDLAKVEAGKISLECVPFDLHGAMEDVLDLLAVRAREKHLRLLLRYSDETPRNFLGDPGRIRQILLNLCSNAIKFTESGHVTLACDCRPRQGSAENGLMSLTIQVIDTGIGIPAEHQAKLFQKFQQVDSSNTRRKGGTGLGLAISKEFAELMGGSIRLTSVVGVGTTFSCEVQLRPVAGVAADDDSNTGPAGRLARVAGRVAGRIAGRIAGRTVLIAGECQASRAIFAENLRRWGFVADDVDSRGEGATQMAAEGGYEVICLDGAPGNEAAPLMEWIQRQAAPDGRGPAIVLLATGNGTPTAIEHDACLLQPFREFTLLSTIDDLVQVRRGESGQRPVKTDFGSATPTASAVTNSRPLRILLVEDNVINQKVGSAMLAKLGCEVELAMDGRQGCAMAAQRKYDLILMDCMMPDMDGFEATRRIREGEADGKSRTPVIAMTAGVMDGDSRQCLAAGMDDFLSKPASLAQLRAMLEKWTPAVVA